MSDEQTKKEGKLCRGEGGVKAKTKPLVLSVGVSSVPREGKCCSSESCMHISADSFDSSSASNITTPPES